jgi:ribonuclease T2
MKVLFILLLGLFAFQIQGYDYYKFAVELPGAVCRSQTCDSADLGNLHSYMLNMHGMWPDANDGSTIEDCLTNNYDESQLTSTVLKQINTDWVGLYSSSATFRSHEWGKHGTCWAQQNENPSIRRAFL